MKAPFLMSLAIEQFLGRNRENKKIMLELTITSGMELKIGDDVKIVFKGSNAPGRMRIGVDAPKEKRIERVVGSAKQETEPKVVIVNQCRRREQHS